MGHTIERLAASECLAEMVSEDLQSVTQHLQLMRCICEDHGGDLFSHSGALDDLLSD